MRYNAAGIFFTNGTHALAGTQPKKGTITGIGGCKEEGESFLFTAFRETFEELFDITNVPENLIHQSIDELEPKSIFQNKKYINILYSFVDLETLLQLAKQHGIVSELYMKFPTTLEELVFTRQVSMDAEIQQLAILPMKCLQISSEFLEDLQMVLGPIQCF